MLLESDTTKDAAIQELQKQINDIVQDLNVMKEQQALQTSKSHFNKASCVFLKGSEHSSQFSEY